MAKTEKIEKSHPEIAERLTRLRQALGYTEAKAFAEMIGLGPKAWNNYEKGKRRPKIDEAMLICEKTNATLDYIYREEFRAIPHDLMIKLQKAKRRA